MKWYGIYITDWIQAIAAFIAIPGTVWTLIVLLKRDKARESEIQSLSQIASQLTNMLKVSEARHRDSKKPLISVKAVDLNPYLLIRCDFVNSNTQASITEYMCTTDAPATIKLSRTTIANNDGKQSFAIEISYTGEKPDYVGIDMSYETEEGYVFNQYIPIWLYQGKEYKCSPATILDGKNDLKK